MIEFAIGNGRSNILKFHKVYHKERKNVSINVKKKLNVVVSCLYGMINSYENSAKMREMDDYPDLFDGVLTMVSSSYGVIECILSGYVTTLTDIVVFIELLHKRTKYIDGCIFSVNTNRAHQQVSEALRVLYNIK